MQVDVMSSEVFETRLCVYNKPEGCIKIPLDPIQTWY